MAAVLVFGATGVAGSFITASLVENQASFSKLGIFTSETTAKTKAEELDNLRKQNVEVIIGDLTKEADVVSAYQHYDTIVSAVGRNAILTQIELLRLAESTRNVKRFFPSEYGTDIEYFPHSVEERPHQLKLKVRAYIKEHVGRLQICYLVTGPYADLYLGAMPPERSHVGSFDVKARKAVLLGSGDESVSFTTMPDLGKLLVAAVLHPEGADGRTLKVNSFTSTPHQILAEFEKQTGTKWEVSYTPLGQLKELENAAWEQGSSMATVYTLRRIWTEGGTLYKMRDNGLIDAESTETLETAVTRTIQKQA